MRLRQEHGQATVELVALLPVVILLGALVWQGAGAGHTAWVAASAARAAARADAIGGDAAAAARSAVPRQLRGGLRTRVSGDGSVGVTLALPPIVGNKRVGAVTARARFAPQTR